MSNYQAKQLNHGGGAEPNAVVDCATFFNVRFKVLFKNNSLVEFDIHT